MKKVLVSFPYPVDDNRLVNLSDIALLEDASSRFISFGIKLNQTKQILALKLLVVAYDENEDKVFEKELSYKKGLELGSLINEEIELPINSIHGQIIILNIVDENITSFANQGTYSFATYERIVQEIKCVAVPKVEKIEEVKKVEAPQKEQIVQVKEKKEKPEKKIKEEKTPEQKKKSKTIYIILMIILFVLVLAMIFITFFGKVIGLNI